MRKKGIKHHWRPVFDTQADASTSSGSYQTVLNITNKRGKIWLWTKVVTWNNVPCWNKITLDGTVLWDDGVGQGGGNGFFLGEFDFENSFKVEHKVNPPGGGGTVRTNAAYYVFPI